MTPTPNHPTPAQTLELLARYVDAQQRQERAGRNQEAYTIEDSPHLLQMRINALDPAHLRTLAAQLAARDAALAEAEARLEQGGNYLTAFDVQRLGDFIGQHTHELDSLYFEDRFSYDEHKRETVKFLAVWCRGHRLYFAHTRGSGNASRHEVAGTNAQFKARRAHAEHMIKGAKALAKAQAQDGQQGG